LPSIIFNTNRTNLDIVAQSKNLPTFKEGIQIITTFSLTVFAWIFFRAENLEHALHYVSQIFSMSLLEVPTILPKNKDLLFIFIFLLLEWIGREQQYAIAVLGAKWSKIIRWGFYYAIIVSIFYFAGGSEQKFIYFQF